MGEDPSFHTAKSIKLLKPRPSFMFHRILSLNKPNTAFKDTGSMHLLNTRAINCVAR